MSYTIKMYIWFFVCVLCMFIAVLLHFKSVEHVKLQKKYGKLRGVKVSKIYGTISGTMEFIFLIGLWISSQPRFTIPIFSNLSIPIFNFSIPILPPKGGTGPKANLVFFERAGPTWQHVSEEGLDPVSKLEQGIIRGVRKLGSQARVQARLEEELDRLVQRLGLPEQLEVKWVPGGKDGLSGEVVGSTVYVYEKELPEALETLRHEVIEYLLVKHHEQDYVTMINALVDAFNRVMRRRREELVERLDAFTVFL